MNELRIEEILGTELIDIDFSSEKIDEIYKDYETEKIRLEKEQQEKEIAEILSDFFITSDTNIQAATSKTQNSPSYPLKLNFSDTEINFDGNTIELNLP